MTHLRARVPHCVVHMVQSLTAVKNAYETGNHDIVPKLAEEAEFQIRRAAAQMIAKLEVLSKPAPVRLVPVQTPTGIMWEPEGGEVIAVIEEISMRIDSMQAA